MTVFLPNPVDADHLVRVARTMRHRQNRKQEVPVIRVIDLGEGVLHAVEGSHRLTAAAVQGITVRLVVLPNREDYHIPRSDLWDAKVNGRVTLKRAKAVLEHLRLLGECPKIKVRATVERAV